MQKLEEQRVHKLKKNERAQINIKKKNKNKTLA